jgi:NADH-quinone oxidoreductase subunit N
VPTAIEQIHATASLLVPEIILLATACALFLLGPFLVGDTADAAPGLRHRWGLLATVALVIAWAIWYQDGARAAQGALFRLDELTWYTRGVSLSAGILLALILWNQLADNCAAEAYACLLTIILGTNLVAAASDLVSLFLALETVSIPTYVILYVSRPDRTGNEAALKYFLLSVFSSALVLYGMSWLYGVTGTTSFAGIASALNERSAHAGEGMLEIAMALLIAGLCFRLAAVPFHFYAPDVFQGTTAAGAALLSFIPKVVGVVALLRLIPLAGGKEGLSQWAAHDQWIPEHSTTVLLSVLAVLTMFVGNLMALRQKNLFRLLGYSSVAHAGYMLVGLAVGDVLPVEGTQAVLFYLVAYGLMTLGTFALLSGFGGEEDSSLRTDDDIRGLGRKRPTNALLLAICLFSLTGLPPTVGFLGKLNLFLAAWSEGTHIGSALAIILGINAAIAAYYYLRIVALMFLDPAADADGPRASIGWSAWLAGGACAVGSIALFVDPQWLLSGLP